MYASPRLDGFAAGIGLGDIPSRFAAYGLGRLLVEMRDCFNPDVRDERIVVKVEFAVLVADGGDAAATGRSVIGPYRIFVPRSLFPFHGIKRRYGPENIRSTERRALRPDALHYVCQGRIDVICSLALYAVERFHDRARARIGEEHRVALIDGRIAVCRRLGHHARPGARFGDAPRFAVIGILREKPRLPRLGRDVAFAVAGGEVCP